MIIKSTRRLFVLLGLILILPLSVGLILSQTKLGSRAAGGEARLSFVTGSELVVRANTGLTKAGFVKAEWTFDPAKIRLSSEIVTTDSLKTVVQKTTMSQANTSGRVTVVLGLAPTDLAIAPSSDFEIARMQIETVSNTPNDRAELVFDPDHLQVVDDAGIAMSVIPTNSGYDLNVVRPTVTTAPNIPSDPTVVPTVEPTVAPSATIEPTAEPTADPTTVPTNTPVPTIAPTSTPIPTLVPSATPTRTPTATPTRVPSVPTVVATLIPTSIVIPTSTVVPTPIVIKPGKGKVCFDGDLGTVFANYGRSKDIRILFSELYTLATKGRCK